MSTADERWRSIVDGYSSSALTVAEYCHRRRISPASFYRWRRLLGGPTSGAPGPGEPAASPRLGARDFVEAIVRSAAGSTSTAPVIEVRRWRIVVPEGFDHVTLGRVVATLDRLDIDGQAVVRSDLDVDSGVRAVSRRAEVGP